jgi:hypothetical protein
MKVRITIEYDPEWEDGLSPEGLQKALDAEQLHWLKGNVDISDLEFDQYKFEIVEESHEKV